MAELRIEGRAAPDLEPLVDVFAREFSRQQVGGAALAVLRDGEVLVDLRAGDHAIQGGRQLLFSVSKLITAVVCAMAVERGLLDIDEPLHRFWPEFDRQATRGITLRMVLGHRSGLVGLHRDIPVEELIDGGLERRLGEETNPVWEPDTDHGYHAWSFGALISGAMARRTGLDVATFLRRYVNPAAASDIQLGVGGSALDLAPLIVQHLTPTPLQRAWAESSQSRFDALARGALADIRVFNDPRVAEANWPASNMMATAIDIARVVDGVVSGRLIRPSTLSELTATRSRGRDRVLGTRTHYGLGVQLPSVQIPMLGPGSFGHEGAGGAMAVGVPHLGLAIGYTTNVLIGVKGASSGIQPLLSAIRHCAELGRGN
ncbi:esterase [Acrocarpospora pleiomorpha]|uniref:Esterase n=1 Tax=Acrocarpospora pleiomorpha TaxID=90975 RepID=A0A5M3XWY9_9ACTN|nr:serine hydrolase domain-containing protein [Acrocarpospora pleiomorpha]GES23903.1 esterase [Acrocarpospora pleiomorpha]